MDDLWEIKYNGIVIDYIRHNCKDAESAKKQWLLQQQSKFGILPWPKIKISTSRFLKIGTKCENFNDKT